jgi:hypothetical protein
LASIVGVAAIVALMFRHSASEETVNRMLPGPIGQWYVAVTHQQELEDEVKRVQQRCDAKIAVVADVIAGRLTLFEAAARFRGLNASNPQAEYWLTTYAYPDQPYELALCRSVIDRVAVKLRSQASGEPDDTVARLEAELAEHLNRHGRICLPD